MNWHEIMNRMIPFDEVIRTSAESKIRLYERTPGAIRFHFFQPERASPKQFSGELESIVQVLVNAMITEDHLPVDLSTVLSCHLRLIDLSALRTNQWGFYVPCDDAKIFHREIADGLSLVYGLHARKYRLLFQIRSAAILFQAPVGSSSDIQCYCSGKNEIR